MLRNAYLKGLQPSQVSRSQGGLAGGLTDWQEMILSKETSRIYN